MQFVRASAEALMAAARSRSPTLFDRLMRSATVASNAECWPLTISRNRDGYGQLRVNGTKERAHRLMYSLFYPGSLPEVVRHACNNPACINPAHLRGGTPKDNAEDRMACGHSGDLRGVNNGRSVLTEANVLAIKASALSGAALGRQFGVSKAMACRIKRGQAWPHLNGGAR